MVSSQAPLLWPTLFSLFRSASTRTTTITHFLSIYTYICLVSIYTRYKHIRLRPAFLYYFIFYFFYCYLYGRNFSKSDKCQPIDNSKNSTPSEGVRHEIITISSVPLNRYISPRADQSIASAVKIQSEMNGFFLFFRLLLLLTLPYYYTCS